jgi:hypothetical protein
MARDAPVELSLSPVPAQQPWLGASEPPPSAEPGPSAAPLAPPSVEAASAVEPAKPSVEPAKPSVEPAKPSVEPAKPSVVWRFRSAAPVSGSPAVSPAGLVYVSTVEGYVHALEPDGAFRWSYGVVGIPIGAPAVDAAGQVYVATTAQRLYALRPDGRLGWMQHAAARFATPPVWAAPGYIYYVGRDQNIYHLADWNGAPSGRYLGQPASVPLASLGDGAVALGTAAPDAQVFRRSSLVAHLALESGLVQPLLGGKGHWFALTRAGLFAFDVATHALAWNGPARRAGASADERTLVVELERELVWLAPHTGGELYRIRLPGDVSAPPVVTNAGIAVVPMVSGELLMVEPRGALIAHAEVARAPAWPPVWSEPTRRVTAAAGAEVVGLDLSAWSHAFGEPESPTEPASDDSMRGAVDDPSGNGGRPIEWRAPARRRGAG